MSIAISLFNQLTAAGLPVTHVSVGRLDDKKTWALKWSTALSPTEESTAAAIVAAIDPMAVSITKTPLDRLFDLLITKGVLTAAEAHTVLGR
jgi:hypothetical protein